MPSSHWGNRLAAVLVFLAVGIAFILTLAATPEGNLHKQENATHQQTANGNDEQQDPPNVAGWWSVAEAYVKAEDSLAQWLMMILGLAGVVLSGLAVYWVKGTLDVTRKMAEDSREIGEAQASAYLSIGTLKVRLVDGRKRFSATAPVKNSGVSPAINVQGEIGIIVYDSKSEFYSTTQSFHIGDIPSGDGSEIGGFFLGLLPDGFIERWEGADQPRLQAIVRVYGRTVFRKQIVVRKCFMRLNLVPLHFEIPVEFVSITDPIGARMILGKFPELSDDPRD